MNEGVVVFMHRCTVSGRVSKKIHEGSALLPVHSTVALLFRMAAAQRVECQL